MRLDAIGDRLKEYEKAETSGKFLPMLPVYARLDGRSFSKFTKGMNRPFDKDMSEVMTKVTMYLVEETGALTGYTQSDEISLVYMNDNPKGSIFFAGKKQKMCSSLAALATAKFVYEASKIWPDKVCKRLPTFDARVFQLPNKVEAMNCFLWRVQDATKNSVSMAASEFFSHKQLNGKDSNEKKQMLLSKGVVWEDYPEHFKNGGFVKREEYLKPVKGGDKSTLDSVVRCKVVVSSVGYDFYKMSTEERVEFCFVKKITSEEAFNFLWSETNKFL